MKICPICRQTFPTKAALAAHLPTHQGKRRGQRQNRNAAGSTLTLSLKEYWGSVQAKSVTTVDVKPSASTLPKLSGQAAMFETYKLLSFTVNVVHGGNQSGSGVYFMGVSYKADKHPTDSKGVASLSPSTCKNAGENASISAPCARLMGQPWLDTSGTSPGAIMLSNDTNTNLHIWVTYKVVFNGPTAVAQSAGNDVTYRWNGQKWLNNHDQAVEVIDLEGDVYGELEVAGEESMLDVTWRTMQQYMQTARELHRAWTVSIGLVNFVANAGRVILPRLQGGPAILHIQPRPFRATRSEWRLLGFEETRGGVGD